MRPFGPALFLTVFFCCQLASAAGVSLATPQSDYYALTGTNAIIPLTIASEYSHDVTGTLQETIVPVIGTNGMNGTTIRTRSFSAFTDPRVVSLNAGTSASPGDYLYSVRFTYDENGQRIATLGPVRIHFLTDLDNIGPSGDIQMSVDMPESGGTSGNQQPQETPSPQSSASTLQNSQMSQDTSTLKQQLAQEQNESRSREVELEQYLSADPIFLLLNQSLTRSGYSPGAPDITPVSNVSGRFLIRYSSVRGSASIRGYLENTSVQYAEISSEDSIPLPEILLANKTHQEYGCLVAGNGFALSETRINATSDGITVDLTFSNGKGKYIHEKASLANETVISFETDSPDDPFSLLATAAAAIVVLALCTGIYLMAKSRPPVLLKPSYGLPAAPDIPRETASRLLDEAEAALGRGTLQEGYRLTGRALRVFLSRDAGAGDELTSGEAGKLAEQFPEHAGQLRDAMERCSIVAFAKGNPDTGELRDLICFSRSLMSVNQDLSKQPEPSPTINNKF